MEKSHSVCRSVEAEKTLSTYLRIQRPCSRSSAKSSPNPPGTAVRPGALSLAMSSLQSEVLAVGQYPIGRPYCRSEAMRINSQPEKRFTDFVVAMSAEWELIARNRDDGVS